MNLVKLFLTFLEVGAVSFGGGYGMISLIREKMLSHGWLTEEEIINMIAVAESTPGPIAVNMATFVGSRQGGVLGSLLATLGVVLPSFVIILLIVSLIRNLLKFPIVQAFLKGVRPCVIGLIIATGVMLLLKALFAFSSFGGDFIVDYKAVAVFVAMIVCSLLYKRFFKKKPSPILLICLSAIMGVLLY